MGVSINELFNVAGKVAVVTGGSRGIGRMIAEAYVENGVKTYITARKEACQQTANELNQKESALRCLWISRLRWQSTVRLRDESPGKETRYSGKQRWRCLGCSFGNTPKRLRQSHGYQRESRFYADPERCLCWKRAPVRRTPVV